MCDVAWQGLGDGLAGPERMPRRHDGLREESVLARSWQSDVARGDRIGRYGHRSRVCTLRVHMCTLRVVGPEEARLAS